LVLNPEFETETVYSPLAIPGKTILAVGVAGALLAQAGLRRQDPDGRAADDGAAGVGNCALKRGAVGLRECNGSEKNVREYKQNTSANVFREMRMGHTLIRVSEPGGASDGS